MAPQAQGPKSRSKGPGGIDRLAAGNPGDVKPVGAGISELRIDYGPGYRVYYLHEGDLLIVLLCGGDKSSQDNHIAAGWRSDEQGT